jgi:fatty acid desaturase
MGTTMNHVAAVTVPWLLAFFWVRASNYTIPFWIGAGVAVLALIGTQALPNTPHRPNQPKPDPDDEMEAATV